ncbi:MAG TPA: nitrate- and nitrite sensing domain-containing protein, partial [Pseudonocardia sp.]
MTSTETGPTWSERFNPRNWTLAWKLVIVCLIPALLALALGVLRVSDQAGQAAELGRSSRLLEVAQQVSTTADALRAERNASTLFAAGNRTDNRAALEDGFRQTDTEIDQMLAAVHGTSELEVTTRSALQKTERELQILAPLRTDAAQDVAVDYDQVKSRYTAVIDSVDILGRALLRQLSTPGIGGLPDALTAVMNITEQLAAQHTELGAAIRSRTLRPQDAEAATAADSQLTAAAREYSSALTLGVVGNPLDETANTQRENLKAAILDTPANKPITSVRADEWDAAYIDADAAADRASTRIRKALSASSAAAEERASNEAGLNSVILMLGLLIGATIAVLVARALLRSLQILRTTALDVAERRLPQAVEGMRAGETPDVEVDPVPLGGRDEVAQVARAFDAVHGQAVRLAAEQAALQSNVSAMFVNLSRRSQALVERQLQLIEQLESNEQDPDQLSNLFQLDHLATRMRRNSENLLVLAGTDLAKRNIAPIPMVDVLRAAVSEVEQYQRIVVQAPPSVTVVGRAASDLVHLLAELLDNATSFSPPDSQVVMSTARTGDGSIVVEIADRGVGMVDHELNDANQRLSGPAGVDVSASRRMGLFVVGRLGARHGISVRLSTSSAGGPGAGLTASVTVPGYLIPSSNEPAETHRPAAAIPTRTNTLTAQRPGTNGSVRPGSLSALVAGTDGPANPAGVFDAPAGHDGQLFAPQPPPVNGSLGKLPTRRPGQSVRPDGPNPPPPNNRPDPAEQAAADQAKAEQQQMQLQRARELAAKAAADAAKISEQQQQRREQQRSSGQPPGSQNTGSYRNGVQPDSARSVWGSTSE